MRKVNDVGAQFTSSMSDFLSDAVTVGAFVLKALSQGKTHLKYCH